MPGFKKIYIEITNRCNLACPFCAQSSRVKAFMAAAAFTEVLRRIHGATRFISFHVLGEPLLHPEFCQLLAISGEQGMQVNLTTNGTLLGRHRRTLLTAPALRQINISLHGLAHLEREAAEGHLQEMIDFAKEASRTTRLYISLRLWNLGTGKSQEGSGWNEWLLERLGSAFALPVIRADALRAERGLPLAPRVFLNPEPQFSWPHLSSPDLGRQGYCRGLRDHLAILVDGTVVPCCLDAEGLLALGNIFSQSLDDILAGPRARRMEEGFGHQWLVEPLCRRCSYRLRFSTTSRA
ncbi:radical SAM/SPASM domain-containing protein [uncultured Desulfobulbus sp.]|uniref:radical SAM/SPASM domain-containing protein n=1 Tax=uncultured Desulfobulbus sp. TaxID=239745 RepID=UPI0029C8E43D|nr:radical SAM/SPASM domain-containing protein [uncultured Desulfobulbus sp.]